MRLWASSTTPRSTRATPSKWASTTDSVSRNCYDDQNPQSNDFPLFPVLKKTIEAMLCIDTSTVFLSGYSSGSWWVNSYAGILPACARALTNDGCATTTCDPSSAQTTEP